MPPPAWRPCWEAFVADFSVVTGAFSYSGSYITKRLLERGERVVTLVREPPIPAVLPRGIHALRYDEDDNKIIEAIAGARCFFNTYWVRFERDTTTFDAAVAKSARLIALARKAEVRRFVHVSITKPSLDGPPYFVGKAQVEAELAASGVPHSIVRPTTLFGGIDVFMNNLAWLLRRFPLFVLPGRGDYRLQPIHVDDLARLCVDASDHIGNETFDAAGPETFTFKELLRVLREATASHCLLVPAPVPVALALSKIVGTVTKDVVVTRRELEGLMAELIVSDEPPRGTTSFTAWAMANGSRIGKRYESEIRRNFRHTA